MQQQQQQLDYFDRMKRNTNIMYWVCYIHQRALMMPFRKYNGVQALGFPCFFGFALIFLWWMFTGDSFLFLWGGFWLLCLVGRRIETTRYKAYIPSRYEGDSVFLRNQKSAKLVLEPAIVVWLGVVALKYYEMQGWRPNGLPYFLLVSVVTLPFVQIVNQMVWDKQLQAMSDARIENEVRNREFRDRFGG